MLFNNKFIPGRTLILLVSLSGSFTMAQNSEGNCSDIIDNTARLACYDQVNDQKKILDLKIQAPAVEQEVESVQMDQKDQKDQKDVMEQAIEEERQALAEDSFGLELKPKVASKNEPKLNIRTFTLTAARHNDFTGWTLEFGNGQIWKQIGTDSYRIRVGKQYTIKRAAFNSFLLGNLENNRNIRITRSK